MPTSPSPCPSPESLTRPQFVSLVAWSPERALYHSPGRSEQSLCARSPWLRATLRNRTQAKERLGRSPFRTPGRGGSPCPPIGPAGRGGSPCPPIGPAGRGGSPCPPTYVVPRHRVRAGTGTCPYPRFPPRGVRNGPRPKDPSTSGAQRRPTLRTATLWGLRQGRWRCRAKPYPPEGIGTFGREWPDGVLRESALEGRDSRHLPPERSNTFGRVTPHPATTPNPYPPEGIGTFGREWPVFPGLRFALGYRSSPLRGCTDRTTGNWGRVSLSPA